MDVALVPDDVGFGAGAGDLVLVLDLVLVYDGATAFSTCCVIGAVPILIAGAVFVSVVGALHDSFIDNLLAIYPPL